MKSGIQRVVNGKSAIAGIRREAVGLLYLVGGTGAGDLNHRETGLADPA